MTDRLKEKLIAVESSGSPMSGPDVTTCWYRNPDGPEALDRITQLEAEALGFERALRVSLWNEARRQGMSQDKAIREVEKAVETLRTESRAALHQGDRKP